MAEDDAIKLKRGGGGETSRGEKSRGEESSSRGATESDRRTVESSESMIGSVLCGIIDNGEFVARIFD